MPQKAEGTPARTSRVYRFRDLKGAGVSYTRKHITDLESAASFRCTFSSGPILLAGSPRRLTTGSKNGSGAG